MRACAGHPWRVIGAWIAIAAMLVFVVATVGGGLKDEFEIPGSDTQKATDLVEAEFAEEQGGVLNVVFAAPGRPAARHAGAQGGRRRGDRSSKSSEFTPTEDKAGLEEVGNPFDEDTFSDDGRIAYTEGAVRPGDLRRGSRTPSSRSRKPFATRWSRPESSSSSTATRSSRPSSRGRRSCWACWRRSSSSSWSSDAFVAAAMPIALALTAVAMAFILLFILAGLTDINTITPLLVSMIGIGVGIDYSLFIVTRFRQLLHDGLSPKDAAAEAGSSAGRAVLFAGLTVAISVTGLGFFGLDFVTKLGIGSALGVLTTVLIANSLLIAVLAKLGHKIDRLKVPFLRQIDDSEAARQKTLIARWGRFVTAHAKPVFVILLLAGLALASTSALVRLGASDQGTQPKEQTARRHTTCSPRASAQASTRRFRIVVDLNGDDQGGAAHLRARARAGGRGIR